MSDLAATSAGLAAQMAPRSTSGFAFSALRFQITGFCPWSSSRATIAAPMRPRPQNPIFMNPLP